LRVKAAGARTCPFSSISRRGKKFEGFYIYASKTWCLGMGVILVLHFKMYYVD